VIALTVCQPVATAMVTRRPHSICPVKPIENRSWGPKRIPLGGLLIAIHAGAKWWNPEGTPTAKYNMPGVNFVGDRWVGPPIDLRTVPTSAFVGVIRVVAVTTADLIRHFADPRVAKLPGAFEAAPWALGPKCWLIDACWALPEPIPFAKGRLNLWHPPAEIDARLHAVVEAD
jgi:hypothetical protein